MTILYASREVADLEKIAEHAPSGDLWLLNLTDGTTVPAFGHQLEVLGAARQPASGPTAPRPAVACRGLVLALAVSLAAWVPIVWGTVWLVRAVIA